MRDACQPIDVYDKPGPKDITVWIADRQRPEPTPPSADNARNSLTHLASIPVRTTKPINKGKPGHLRIFLADGSDRVVILTGWQE